MASTYHKRLNHEELEAVAWGFLSSEFTSEIYCDWPLDKRVDAYLVHNGPAQLLSDGSGYNALLDRIMANIGVALRNGVLPSPEN